MTVRRLVPLLSALVAGVLAGCHSEGARPAPEDAGPPSDAPDDAPLDALPAPADAGADVEQDPNTYPAKHGPIPQIDYLTGPVLKSPKVVTVTFQGDVWRADLEAFDDAIVSSDFWKTSLSEYGVGAGASGGHVSLVDDVSNQTIVDEDIGTYLQGHIQKGDLPGPDANTIYVLYYPAASDVFYANRSLQSCVDFLGYHSEARIALEAGMTTVPYAVVARCPGLGADMERYALTTAGHVLAEAATDPFALTDPAYKMTTNDAWRLRGASAARDEVGDLCAYRTKSATIDAGGAPAQRVWSNRAALASQPPCVPALPGEIWFGAAVRTELQQIDVHKSYGYLVIPRGESQDAVIDVWSGAALPHDLSLLVGVDHGALSATNLDPLPAGLTASLSRSLAHNGNGVIMHVTVPSAVPRGDYGFVVRAILDPDTYYDWPVLVRAK